MENNFLKNKNGYGKIIGVGILLCAMILAILLVGIILLTPIGVDEFVIASNQSNDFVHAAASDTNLVEIFISNTPPDAPVISGTMIGKIGKSYDYIFVSIDDDGDDLQYNISWGDGNIITTNFYPNSTVVTKSHNFSVAGVYIISAYALDKYNKSDTTNFEVLISSCWIKEKGYLIDYNGDEVYEMFYSNSTDRETEVEQSKAGMFLINEDGEGEWDFVYDKETDTITSYMAHEEEEADYTYLYLFIIIIIILLVIIGYLVDRNEKKQEPKKPETKKPETKKPESKKPPKKTPKKKN